MKKPRKTIPLGPPLDTPVAVVVIPAAGLTEELRAYLSPATFPEGVRNDTR